MACVLFLGECLKASAGYGLKLMGYIALCLWRGALMISILYMLVGNVASSAIRSLSIRLLQKTLHF
jgi:hypothetical protein